MNTKFHKITHVQISNNIVNVSGKYCIIPCNVLLHWLPLSLTPSKLLERKQIDDSEVTKMNVPFLCLC